MPLFLSYHPSTQAPGSRRQLAASPGLESLVFLRPRDSLAVGQHWGETVPGWVEVEPAGIVGDVVTVRSTDEYAAIPFVSGATPVTGRVQMNLNPDQQIIGDIIQSYHGKVFEFRYVYAPPNMHVIHGDYLFSGATRSAAGSDAGITYETNITPIPDLIDFGGAYYRSSSYDVEDFDNTIGVPLLKLPGSLVLDATRGDGSPARIGLRVDSSGNIRFWSSSSSQYANIPRTHSVQCLVYAPGIGYALSSVDTNGGTGQMSTFIFNDDDFGLALRANTPTIYAALYAVNTDRGALR